MEDNRRKLRGNRWKWKEINGNGKKSMAMERNQWQWKEM